MTLINATCTGCGYKFEVEPTLTGLVCCPECKNFFDAKDCPEGRIRSESNPTPESFDQWALVELFGHQQIVGKVTQTTQLGGAFLRVDVPTVKGVGEGYTRYFHPNAIYSINPLEEKVARSLLTQSRFRNEPVKTYDVPLLPDRDEEPE